MQPDFGYISVQADFVADYCDFCRGILLQENIGIPSSLQGGSLISETLCFFERRLPQYNWQVFISQELIGKQISTHLRQAIDHIRNMAETGESLNSLLSKKTKKLQKNDELLADWKIYHLHMPKYIYNTDCNAIKDLNNWLLFVYMQDNGLYFIDVLKHKNFTKINLLEILQKNWPNLIEPFAMRGMPSVHVTDDICKILRKKRVNTAYIINGRAFFSPGLGMIASGMPTRVEVSAAKIHNYLQMLQLECIQNDKQEIYIKNVSAKYSQQGVLFLKESIAYFQLKFFPNDLYLKNGFNIDVTAVEHCDCY